jgi:hypothetical protein
MVRDAGTGSDNRPMRRTELERTVGVSGEADGPDPTPLPPAQEAEMCSHTPICPTATAPDHSAAHVVVAHPEQGWSLLCNGVVLFDDYGELLPDGRALSPRASMSAWRSVALPVGSR